MVTPSGTCRASAAASCSGVGIGDELDVGELGGALDSHRAGQRERDHGARLHAPREGDLVARAPQRGQQHVNGLEMREETCASLDRKGDPVCQKRVSMFDPVARGTWPRPPTAALGAAAPGRIGKTLPLHCTGSPRRPRHQAQCTSRLRTGAEAGAAVAAAVPAAVAGGPFGLALLPLVEQELGGHAGLDVAPRQLVPGRRSSRVASASMVVPGGERVVPGLLLEHLGPGVEAGAVAPCRLDHRRPCRRRRARARPRASRCAASCMREPDLAGRHRPAHVRLLRRRAGRGATWPPTGTACAAWARVRDADVHAERAAAPCVCGRSRARAPVSTMPRTSSSVSVGRPIMKYSFSAGAAAPRTPLDRAAR